MMRFSSYKTFFKALSNETRFEIVKLLKEKGHKTVSEICKELRFEQSRVSHNLQCLVACGFLNVKQHGKTRIYSIDKNIARILDKIDRHMKKYGKRFETCDILKGKKTCKLVRT